MSSLRTARADLTERFPDDPVFVAGAMLKLQEDMSKTLSRDKSGIPSPRPNRPHPHQGAKPMSTIIDISPALRRPRPHRLKPRLFAA